MGIGRRIVVAIACAVVVVGCTSTAAASSGRPSDNVLQRHLVAEVTGAGAFTHLEVLQRIADDNGGNRASPGPGYNGSVLDHYTDAVAGTVAHFAVSTDALPR